MADLHPFSAQANRRQAHLRVMEITDIHMHLLPYDYYADRPVDTVGLARTATLIEEARKAARNSLLFDNGDFLQGNPMGDYIAYERGFSDGDIHPVIAAMNRLGLDASTLGNHEFNYGLDFLQKAIAGADYPIVAANVVRRLGPDPRGDTAFVPPYAILDRLVCDGAGTEHPIRVGVIGVLPPQIIGWDSQHLDRRLEVRDIVEATRAWIPEMQEAGADIIVALAHTGIGASRETAWMENAAVPLAALDGIDALLTGHRHGLFPAPKARARPAVDPVRGTLHGKPAVMAGCWGSHLGLIDLKLEFGEDGWRVADFEVATRPIAERRADDSVRPLTRSLAAIRDTVKDDHEATLDFVRRPVGRCDHPIQSYFAQLGCGSSVSLVNRAQSWFVTRLLADRPEARLPVLSAASAFKAGGSVGPENYTDVPPGDLSIRNIADIYGYPNTLAILRLTGRNLRLWLEHSASMFNRIVPGDSDQPLLDPDFSSYDFDVLHGVDYEIDLTQPKMAPEDRARPGFRPQRITRLTFRDRPVTDDMVFALATNSYRAGGGGNFPGLDRTVSITDTRILNRDVVLRYIREVGTIGDLSERNWRFRPCPGTSVLFDTGPGALRYESEIDHLPATRLGPVPGGFVRYRLPL